MVSNVTPLIADVQFVLDTHNQIRQHKLFLRPSDRSHFINENTIVRLAAVLEAHCVKAPAGKAGANPSWGEICVRTLFFFRNIIVHETAGEYEPKLLGSSKRHIPAWELFCERHCEAEVKPSEQLRLPAHEVIQPLLQGCLDYCRELAP